MIQSEVSGILFTANPVNGNRDEVVINASWGLGEAIVSGLVSPDTLTVQKQGGVIKKRQTASKERLIAYSDNGGTVEMDTPDELREAPALTDEQASELTALGVEIERHYGVPQDIEWGLAQGKWYLLQARPITTLAAEEKVFDVQGEYSRIMLVVILPDALSPVFLSVLLPLVDGMFDFTFKTLGFKPAQGIDQTGAFYNQLYFHREYIEETLSSLSPAVRESLVDQFINPISHEKRAPARELSLAYVSMMARMLRFMVRFPKQLPGILERYQAEIAEIATVPLDGVSDEKIVSHILSLVFEKINRLLNYDFLVIALTGRTYEILENLLEPYYGEETEEVIIKLNSGLDGNVTMETNKRLWDLAQEARASAVVSDALREYEPEVVGTHLQETAEGQEFLKSLGQFLREYGHREIRFDIIYPTWGEDPTLVFGFLRSYLDADESQSPHQQQARLMKERLELTEAVMANFKRDFKGRFLTGPLFHWMLGQAQVHTRERDTMHFEWTRLFAPTRRLLLELGRRWHERGLLERQDDIFFLRYQELEESAVSPTVWEEVVRARRDEFEVSSSRRWPEIIRDGREIYLDTIEHTSITEGDLQGVAGSPGMVTGISRVISGPEEFHKLRQGEILIAPLTNPVWTPLFAVAGGLITEVGGILSHGAIVAREYGIPAVMSVSGATKQIQDGQTITVDGNKGIVYVGVEATA
jgi:pyruvate,water dikinase